MTVTVSTAEELSAALAADAQHIVVCGRLTGLPTITLSPGVSMTGAEAAELVFDDGADGVRLTRDNHLADLRLLVSDPERAAICNDTGQTGLGTLTLRALTVHGRVALIADDMVRTGRVVVRGLDIIAADARETLPRPAGFGVYARQGAFTLYNRQTDPASMITADLTGISAGRADNPVRGSGIFVSGTDGGGQVRGSRLHTGTIHSDGGIPAGTADEITAGVFVVYADFDEVANHGPVTTYGVNDMVLDLWGTVGEWTAHAPITSYGPSGIGFVNFGRLRSLRCLAPIVTHGPGARGFNIYEGSIESAEFDRIETHADAAVGIQVAKPFGTLRVHRGIETHGGTGTSLVKGVLTTLSAVGLSLKPGAHARAIHIDGGIHVHTPGIAPLEIDGIVDELTVTGEIRAAARP